MRRGWMSATVLTTTVLLGAAGCAATQPTVCKGGICSGPGYSPSSSTQIQTGIVHVLSAIGFAAVVPGTAAGPARRSSHSPPRRAAGGPRRAEPGDSAGGVTDPGRTALDLRWPHALTDHGHGRRRAVHRPAPGH
ncbi:hypothetical protein [Crossiella sp. CA198]|uniref:hypothetical protein n=1 Tax=Crossiella sp. CA198 TaxID=3455607 RepID=UPI003F8D6571